jgi:ribonuclease VapC
MSAVNWAEVLSKLAEAGEDPEAVAQDLEDKGLLGLALMIHPVEESLALRIAKLRPLTRHKGLSLGDRACLALAAHLQLKVLTADSGWDELDLGLHIQFIRHRPPTPP